MLEQIKKTLPIYITPSQSFWRALELRKLEEIRDERGFFQPILEIGCGSGKFARLLFESIDLGIDSNPNAIRRCEGIQPFYRKVRVMDARSMPLRHGTYRTVFANCVLEHIPGVESVLSQAASVLMKNGIFVATVPLINMNSNLALRGRRYAHLRRKQLEHHNLFSQEEWKEKLVEAGFAQVSFYPYLSGRHCRIWDLMDAVAMIGYRKYSFGGAFGLSWKFLPDFVKSYYINGLSKLLSRIETGQDHNPCAVVFVARPQ